MDFSKMDSRSAAEVPSLMPILAQSDGSVIRDGKKVCAVLIKGVSSRTAQSEMRAEEAQRMKTAKSHKGKSKSFEEDFTKDLQKSLTESAARFITGFENIQRPDPGSDPVKLRDLTNSPEDIAWFFDLNLISIPHLLRGDGSNMQINEDEHKEDFESRKKFEMEVWLKPSFCQQVIDHAKDDFNFLGQTAQQ